MPEKWSQFWKSDMVALTELAIFGALFVTGVVVSSVVGNMVGAGVGWLMFAGFLGAYTARLYFSVWRSVPVAEELRVEVVSTVEALVSAERNGVSRADVREGYDQVYAAVALYPTAAKAVGETEAARGVCQTLKRVATIAEKRAELNTLTTRGPRPVQVRREERTMARILGDAGLGDAQEETLSDLSESVAALQALDERQGRLGERQSAVTEASFTR